MNAKLLDVRCIWDRSEHAAFPDLLRYRDAWYVSFREGEKHIGDGGGRVVVLRSEDGLAFEPVARFAEPAVDLRDPKLSETPDGRLLVLAGGARYEDGGVVDRRPRVWFSHTGRTFSDPATILWHDEWLWRVSWHEGVAWGVSYSYPPDLGDSRLLLFRSDDGLDWERVAQLAVPGLPSEVTVRVLADRTMLALVRRERRDDPQGWIGVAAPPYSSWSWTPCGHRLGGPNVLELPDGRLIAGSRAYGEGPTYTTVLARLTRTSYEPFLTLPSGGDTSYPGLVWHDGLLHVCWYSSHEGRTALYLARVSLLPESGVPA